MICKRVIIIYIFPDLDPPLGKASYLSYCPKFQIVFISWVTGPVIILLFSNATQIQLMLPGVVPHRSSKEKKSFLGTDENSSCLPTKLSPGAPLKAFCSQSPTC